MPLFCCRCCYATFRSQKARTVHENTCFADQSDLDSPRPTPLSPVRFGVDDSLHVAGRLWDSCSDPDEDSADRSYPDAEFGDGMGGAPPDDDSGDGMAVPLDEDADVLDEGPEEEDGGVALPASKMPRNRVAG